MSESAPSADPRWLARPGSDAYERATRPHNGVSAQRPAAVARPGDAAEVGEALRWADAAGLVVVPQATGHGAGADLDGDVLLLSTAALDAVEIDAEALVARAGAGATWATVQQAAAPHGSAGLSGSAPSVAVSGYTFGGGIGWFVRPYGTAAASLLRVEYVDGAGRPRVAAEDSEDPIDRDAFAVFRGAGGVGIATRLHFRLHPVGDLVAGYLLWPGALLEQLVGAWTGVLADLDATVSSHISLVQAPPGPPFPPELQGGGVAHVAFATTGGHAAAAPLLDALRAVAPPVVDTAGAADLVRLGTIHLDPPPGAAAFGAARWLTGAAADDAVRILRTADGGAIAMAELRHVAGATGVHGPFIAHAVVPQRPGVDRAAAESALAGFLDAVAPVDTGRSLASWAEGAAAVPSALSEDGLALARRTADAVDPDRVIARPRIQSGGAA